VRDKSLRGQLQGVQTGPVRRFSLRYTPDPERSLRNWLEHVRDKALESCQICIAVIVNWTACWSLRGLVPLNSWSEVQARTLNRVCILWILTSPFHLTTYSPSSLQHLHLAMSTIPTEIWSRVIAFLVRDTPPPRECKHWFGLSQPDLCTSMRVNSVSTSSTTSLLLYTT
jgi:hypothetical protein